jgi:hypothetical protein
MRLELEFKDALTGVAAIGGLALGIYNLIRARNADKVRLRVVPKASSYQGHDSTGRDFYLHNSNKYDLNHPTAPPDTLSIDVVNIGKFSVVVDEVGLLKRGTKQRIALVNPIIPDGGSWPRKLEPRESVMVHFETTKLLEARDIDRVKCAYASTTCGETASGTSGALVDFIRIARGVA